MTTIKNILSLAAAIPTLAPTSNVTPHGCGELNVFYTGLPPYHPLVAAQGWDPARVEAGLRNDTVNMVKAGYNVQIVWAGPETPISTLEQRMDATGVEFDLVGLGFGLRGSTLDILVERFEDVVEFYSRKTPNAKKVFNTSPETTLWSLQHRNPLTEDCDALGKHGKLIGYEEICDSRCVSEKARLTEKKQREHNEL